MLPINWEIPTCSTFCVICEADRVITSATRDIELYNPAVTLSAENNSKLL